MALPDLFHRSNRSSDRPSQFLGAASDDAELYEDDDAFVLTIEMPGFERDEIDLVWQDGVLNVAAEHVDEERDRRRTYHRRFRFPKEVDDEGISATYRNGVLEVTLPIVGSHRSRGREIEVTGE